MICVHSLPYAEEFPRSLSPSSQFKVKFLVLDGIPEKVNIILQNKRPTVVELCPRFYNHISYVGHTNRHRRRLVQNIGGAQGPDSRR